jgi:hypothetical protein
MDIVSEIVLCRLVGQADDLDRLNQYRDPRQAIREVATLGRLASWLECREILVPDRDARELMRRAAWEIDETNEAGEDPPAEHDATSAYRALFSDRPVTAEVHDSLRERRQHSAESSTPGGGR